MTTFYTLEDRDKILGMKEDHIIVDSEKGGMRRGYLEEVEFKNKIFIYNVHNNSGITNQLSVVSIY